MAAPEIKSTVKCPLKELNDFFILDGNILQEWPVDGKSGNDLVQHDHEASDVLPPTTNSAAQLKYLAIKPPPKHL